MLKLSKLNKLITMMLSLLCLLILVGSVSATDLTVNSDTSNKNIADWMDSDTTVSGSNLVFNVTSYELSDTLVVSKPINIKSDKNTQINFNKNTEMIHITANTVNFSGLTLNHGGRGVYGNPAATILAPGTTAKTINIVDTSINLRGDYSVGVAIGNGRLSFINSHIRGNGIYNYGVVANDITVNFQRSSIVLNKNYGSGVLAYTKLAGDFTNTRINLQSSSMGIFAPQWTGRFINGEITGKANSYGINANRWNGQVSGSRIILSGTNSEGIFSRNSKGTISRSTIHVRNGRAVAVSGNVKVSGSSAISKKGTPGVYYFGPRMHVLRVSTTTKSKIYTFRITNVGESKSRVSKLSITSGKFKRTVNVKSVNAGRTITLRVTLPSKFATTQTRKAARIFFRNSAGLKEPSNTLNFRF